MTSETYVDDIFGRCFVPSWIQVPYAAGNARVVFIPGLDIVRVLVDTIVYTIYGFDEFLRVANEVGLAELVKTTSNVLDKV